MLLSHNLLCTLVLMPWVESRYTRLCMVDKMISIQFSHILKVKAHITLTGQGGSVSGLRERTVLFRPGRGQEWWRRPLPYPMPLAWLGSLTEGSLVYTSGIADADLSRIVEAAGAPHRVRGCTSSSFKSYTECSRGCPGPVALECGNWRLLRWGSTSANKFVQTILYSSH